MRRARTALLLPALVAACAGNSSHNTLAELRHVEPDVTEVRVDDGLERAMAGYRSFLEETPESALTPEAMRRLADLKIEKEYGLLGYDERPARPAPQASEPADMARPTASGDPVATSRAPTAAIADHTESQQDFERRASSGDAIQASEAGSELAIPGGNAAPAGPLEAIALYDRILAAYPHYQHNDQVLYQKARAYEELGRPDEAIAVVERLIDEYPGSRFIDEVQFRRGEYFFTRKRYYDAELAYKAVTELGPTSEYYELAVYKLGWSLYKQLMHEEALHAYVALLDYKVAAGYDFDQTEDEADERRIADTYRVISLCFSNLGGPEVVGAYFAANGHRPYEDRIYSHHGEFYLEKLRYNDAAAVYRAFVDLYPLHASAPHFSMRVVEIYEAGGFPKLVLEAKKQFAARYGLQAEYWRHADIEEMPEVRSYLKANLADLANHYHALYQQDEHLDQRPAHFEEALRWYRAYLDSFPQDPESPAIHYQLADLLLEHEDFGEAALEYERIAYDYPPHEKSSAAGYAAIYAYREHQKRKTGDEQLAVRQAAVASTLRFVETFPEHEHAAAVLGAAVDDLYEMKEFERAIATGQQLLEAYPNADSGIRRDAWAAVAHSAFEIADYEKAEHGYGEVLEATPAEDESRQAVVDNLAAAIYKQGEQANLAGDYRTAANHFLRISEAAPSSEIRPAAEYDAGAALMRLEDWAGAAAVLESFRDSYPEHELQREATKQIAFVYRQEGDLGRAAAEYERTAREAEDPELQREALMLAGELYEDAKTPERALAVYKRYVRQFPEPLELAVETRFKIAEMYAAAGDEAAYHDELRTIIRIDAEQPGARTPRIRYLAARSSLVLTEPRFREFDEVRLVQPFEKSLQEKQRRMNAAIDAFRELLDYEVAEVTAGATFYMAQIYVRFSKALMESERPTDLGPADLQDYEMVLEEEAFPFEEKGIEVHQKNLELMAAGVYNAWIARSLEELAVLVPGRYAKFEESSGFIGSLDRYAYRPPTAAAEADETLEEDPAGSDEPEAPPAPAPEAVPSEDQHPTDGVTAG